MENDLYQVALRPFTREDIPLLVEWNRKTSEKDLLRWAGPVFTFPLTSEQVCRYLEMKGQSELFAIEANGAAVGIIELGQITIQHRNARVGKVLIGETSFRGRGIALKAIQKVLYIAFIEKNLHKVSLAVLSDNQRAIRGYMRSGFTEEGRLRDHRYAEGHWYDLLEMGLLHSDWKHGISFHPNRSYHTDRLIVRSAGTEDAQKALDYYFRNRSFLAIYGPRRPADYYTKAFQEQMILEDIRREKDGNGLRLWIQTGDDPDRFIGNMTLSHIIQGNFRSCYLGYQLDDREKRKGYMLEALHVMLSIAFKELRLHRVEANIMPENTP
ncbi:MAG: GNAT family N-acetyltransferase, partial [Spirochaetales bacterium]|nr:GNAT family N-acetyltransferase [Spirochaetales bacterium]